QTDISVDWTVKLDVQSKSGANIIDLIRDGDTLYVDLTRAMLQDVGDYYCQLRGANGDMVQHSNQFRLWVNSSINATETLPPLEPSEFSQMEARITELKTATETAAGAGAVSAADAAQSAADADASAQNAAASKQAALAAQSAAETAAGNAQVSSDTATGAATLSGQYRDAAQQYAGNASTAAGNAAASEANAQGYSATATQQAAAAASSTQAAQEAAEQTTTDRQSVAADKQAVETAVTTFTVTTVPNATVAINTQRDAAVADVQDAGAQQITAIQALAVYSQSQVDALLTGKADQPYKTATGYPLEITDSAGGAVKALAVTGGGNPVGLRVCGKNLFIPPVAADSPRVYVSWDADTGTYTFAIDSETATGDVTDTVPSYIFDRTDGATAQLAVISATGLSQTFTIASRKYVEIRMTYTGNNGVPLGQHRTVTYAGLRLYRQSTAGVYEPVRLTDYSFDPAAPPSVTLPAGAANIYSTDAAPPTGISMTYRQDLQAFVMDSVSTLAAAIIAMGGTL
ncbi:MAG: hypothetical protein AB7C89_08775, partial [Intestinibacillus sp.]